MAERLTLSVVMPNYNHARYLEGALENYLRQSRLPDEFLILDDASSDDSMAILEVYARRYPMIRLLRNPTNQGVIRAHQRLFSEAKCDYIHATAADDLRAPNFCELTMRLAEQHPQAGVIFGASAMIDEDGRTLGVLKARRWNEALYAPPDRYLREFLEVEPATQSIATSTTLRRDAFLEVGGYRAELGSWADTFAAHAVALKHGACYTPEVISQWRKATASFSGAHRKDPRRALDLAARAARLMRSDEFRDRFPESYVRRWERSFRRLAIWGYWLGDDARDADGRRDSFLVRNLRRLPRTPRAISLLFHRGGVS